jgi:hypothetical protein
MVRVASARRSHTHYAFDRDVKTSALSEDRSNLSLAEGCRGSGLDLVGLGYGMDANSSPLVAKAAEEGFHFSQHVSLA